MYKSWNQLLENHPAEIHTLLLGLAVAGLILYRRDRWKKMPGAAQAGLAYFYLLAGWLFSVVEEAAGDWLNPAEHACYAASAVFFFLYVRRLTRSREEAP